MFSIVIQIKLFEKLTLVFLSLSIKAVFFCYCKVDFKLPIKQHLARHNFLCLEPLKHFMASKQRIQTSKTFWKKKNAKPLFPRIQNKLQEAANDAKPN